MKLHNRFPREFSNGAGGGEGDGKKRVGAISAEQLGRGGGPEGVVEGERDFSESFLTFVEVSDLVTFFATGHLPCGGNPHRSTHLK